MIFCDKQQLISDVMIFFIFAKTLCLQSFSFSPKVVPLCSSCRTAKGTLTVPRCQQNPTEPDTSRLISSVRNMEKSLSQILLTTCVGSKGRGCCLILTNMGLSFYTVNCLRYHRTILLLVNSEPLLFSQLASIDLPLFCIMYSTVYGSICSILHLTWVFGL
jgi:hypothetical protein